MAADKFARSRARVESAEVPQPPTTAHTTIKLPTGHHRTHNTTFRDLARASRLHQAPGDESRAKACDDLIGCMRAGTSSAADAALCI